MILTYGLEQQKLYYLTIINVTFVKVKTKIATIFTNKLMSVILFVLIRINKMFFEVKMDVIILSAS